MEQLSISNLEKKVELSFLIHYLVHYIRIQKFRSKTEKISPAVSTDWVGTYLPTVLCGYLTRFTFFRFGLALPSGEMRPQFAPKNLEVAANALESLDGLLIASWKFCPYGELKEDLTPSELADRIRSNLTSCTCVNLNLTTPTHYASVYLPALSLWDVISTSFGQILNSCIFSKSCPFRALLYLLDAKINQNLV